MRCLVGRCSTSESVTRALPALDADVSEDMVPLAMSHTRLSVAILAQAVGLSRLPGGRAASPLPTGGKGRRWQGPERQA